MIDMNARRPSLRTDLLLNRAKTVGFHLARTQSLVAGSGNTVLPPAAIEKPSNGQVNINIIERSPEKRTSQKEKRNGHSCMLNNASVPEASKFSPRGADKRCTII